MSARLDIEYDGAAFHGWAAQPGLRTVQGELERALAVVRRAPTPLTVGGRTDRGVHAAAQVASHAGAPADARSVNAVLPPDVRVRRSAPAPEGFDARRDATARTYCLRVLHRREGTALDRGRVVHWRHPLDEELLHACAAALVGEHDFTAFTPTETEHVRFRRRVRRAAWQRVGDELRFWIEADAFMRHMNRILVGTMLEVGGGRRHPADFRALLDGAPRPAAGATLAAHGLVLAGVAYPADRGGHSDAAGAGLHPPWATGEVADQPRSRATPTPAPAQSASPSIA